MMFAPEPKAPEVQARVRQCRQCDALTLDDKGVGKKCRCESSDWEDLIPLPLSIETIDPKSGWRNVYAERALRRLVADVEYLRRLPNDGAEQAAVATCEEFGHDSRAGLCERCGARVARPSE